MKNLTAYVTGASRGIGRAIALRLAREGCRLVICSRGEETLLKTKADIEALGTDCLAITADVGDPSDCEQLFDAARSFGTPDLLINNAGIAHFGLLCDLSDEDWDRIIRTNLSSVFYTCRAVLPSMISKKSGKILNVSSMWGRVGASCEVAYSASKAGVQGLTQALAKELAPSNIQVNAVACGVIDTDMNARLSETDRKNLAEEIPAGRFARPEEVANFLYDLSRSPEYLTGQVIGFDGGYI